MEVQEHQIQVGDSPNLTRAIEQWQRGYPIPLTLAFELMAEGYDVEKLEAQYQT